MKKHLLIFLTTILAMLICEPCSAQNMTAVQDETGRLIWVNGEEAKPRPDASPAIRPSYRHLVYWSQTEHRWKEIPPPSPAMMKAARRAAQEVTSLVAAAPMRNASFRVSEPVPPDTAGLLRGRQISLESIDSA